MFNMYIYIAPIFLEMCTHSHNHLHAACPVNVTASLQSILWLMCGQGARALQSSRTRPCCQCPA